MTPPPDSLHALDDALRRSVEQRVESLLARARHDAAAHVERAQQEADADARRARAEGEAAAAVMLAVPVAAQTAAKAKPAGGKGRVQTEVLDPWD